MERRAGQNGHDQLANRTRKVAQVPHLLSPPLGRTGEQKVKHLQLVQGNVVHVLYF